MSPLFENSEDDVPLPGHRAALEPDSHHTREIDNVPQPEREVTLNTGIVLALFFALALLCAVFFGFGYSMGRKSVPPPVIAESDPTATVADNENSNAAPKPSPGSPASVPVPSYAGPGGAPVDGKPAPAKPAPASVAAPSGTPDPASRTRPASDTATTQAAVPVVRVTPPTTLPATVSTTSQTGTGAVYVQVSAVSHQEDADVLLGALRRRGYTVFTRSDPNDRLIHVQLGPYATKKDADAMRQRLSGDGYNAILK